MEQIEPFVQFLWPRATGRGYSWQTMDIRREDFEGPVSRSARILTFPAPRPAPRKSAAYETIDPIERKTAAYETISPLEINPTILWQFSDIDVSGDSNRTEDSIRNFANNWGLLIGDWFGAPNGKGPIYFGDRIETWIGEIRRAQKARNIWQAIEDEDSKTLAKWIQWSKHNVSVHFRYSEIPPGVDERLIASPQYEPATFALFEPGDLILPAKIFLSRIINDQLALHTCAKMLWSNQEQKVSLYLVPSNLLGAMWAQFGLAIDGRKSVGRCESCGNWIEGQRNTKRYCSSTCRTRATRKRQGKKR